MQQAAQSGCPWRGYSGHAYIIYGLSAHKSCLCTAQWALVACHAAASCKLIRPPLLADALSHLHICEISSRWWRWQDDVTANLAACDNQFRTNRTGGSNLEKQVQRTSHRDRKLSDRKTQEKKKKKKLKTKTKTRELSKIHYARDLRIYVRTKFLDIFRTSRGEPVPWTAATDDLWSHLLWRFGLACNFAKWWRRRHIKNPISSAILKGVRKVNEVYFIRRRQQQ